MLVLVLGAFEKQPPIPAVNTPASPHEATANDMSSAFCGLSRCTRHGKSRVRARRVDSDLRHADSGVWSVREAENETKTRKNLKKQVKKQPKKRIC